MPLSARLLLAATALYCFASLLVALPLEGIGTGYKCRCLTTTSTKIRPSFFKSIEILPPGGNCRNTEILITMKNSKVVCVSPHANWVKDIISKVVQKSKRSVKHPVLTSTS